MQLKQPLGNNLFCEMGTYGELILTREQSNIVVDTIVLEPEPEPEKLEAALDYVREFLNNNLPQQGGQT